MSHEVRVPVMITRTLHTHVTMELDDEQFDLFVTDQILITNQDELEDLYYSQYNEEDFFEESLIFEVDNAYEH